MKASRILALGLAAITATAVSLTSGPATAQGPFELNIGSLAPKATPWMDMLEKIEAQVEEASGNRINVILRPPGVMGEVEMVRETRKGERLQGAAVTTAAIAEGGNIPVLSIVELPFLFKDNKEADHVMDTVLFDLASEAMAKRGFVLGVWSENGWRSFATKGEPIRTPDDVKKFKMRAQESDVHMEMYKAFGANAVQKPMTEVLSALQSDVVDGLDNSALFIQSAGLAEPLDYFTLTRHIYQPAAIVYSKRFYDTLPLDLQKVLLAPKSLAAEGRQGIRDEDEAMIENMSLLSVDVIELTDEEREAFAKQARTIHESYASGIEGGKDWLDAINAGLKELR